MTQKSYFFHIWCVSVLHILQLYCPSGSNQPEQIHNVKSASVFQKVFKCFHVKSFNIVNFFWLHVRKHIISNGISVTMVHNHFYLCSVTVKRCKWKLHEFLISYIVYFHYIQSKPAVWHLKFLLFCVQCFLKVCKAMFISA